MTLTKSLFDSALRSVSSIARGRATEDSVKLLKLEASHKTFRMSANDTGQYAVAEIECDGELSPICVAAHSLQNISALFGEEITMFSAQSVHLKIESNGNFNLNTMPVDQFTEIPTEKLTKIGVNCVDLAECVDKVQFAARKSDDKPALHGVFVRLMPTKMIIQAHTGQTMAVMEKASISATAEFIVPLDFVPNVVNALQCEGAVLSVSPTRILIEHATGCYSCVLVDDKFPNMDAQLVAEHPSIGEFNPRDWLPVFRAVVAMGGKDGSIRTDVHIAEGRITSQSSQGAVDRSIDKLDKPLRLNAATFIPCLEAFDDGICKASLYDEFGAFRVEQGELSVLSTQLRS